MDDLTNIIREMMAAGRMDSTQLPRGLWLSYRQIHGMHRLTISRKGQWPSPTEREIVQRCILAASSGEPAVKCTHRQEKGRASGVMYYGYQFTWAAVAQAALPLGGQHEH